MPLLELKCSCVVHLYGRYGNGSPWLWILNRTSVPEYDCADCVCQIKFALPNDLWIGGVPCVFRPGHRRLSAMTFLPLSLGRAVVQKVIAEHLELQMRSSVACGPTRLLFPRRRGTGHGPFASHDEQRGPSFISLTASRLRWWALIPRLLGF